MFRGLSAFGRPTIFADSSVLACIYKIKWFTVVFVNKYFVEYKYASEGAGMRHREKSAISVQVWTRVSPEVAAQLDALAERHRRRRADLLRLVVEDFTSGA